MVVVVPLLNHRRRSFISLATTFIIFIITVSQLMRVLSSTAKTTGHNDSVVEYVEVDSGTAGVTRYAAVRRISGDSKSTIPISIQSWMTMVASASSPATDSVARDLSTIIVSSSYESSFFETPGTSYQTSNDVPFEFVLVNNPGLKAFAERNANRNAFAEHFFKEEEEEEKLVCSFVNIGGDAYLVSPLPLFKEVDNDVTYSHLLKFVREAPEKQVLEFWRVAASTYLNVLEQKHQDEENPPGRKTWFSTNGMGVAWLHLRIDDRPKYYSYAPFMN